MNQLRWTTRKQTVWVRIPLEAQILILLFLLYEGKYLSSGLSPIQGVLQRFRKDAAATGPCKNSFRDVRVRTHSWEKYYYLQLNLYHNLMTCNLCTKFLSLKTSRYTKDLSYHVFPFSRKVELHESGDLYNVRAKVSCVLSHRSLLSAITFVVQSLKLIEYPLLRPK